MVQLRYTKTVADEQFIANLDLNFAPGQLPVVNVLLNQ